MFDTEVGNVLDCVDKVADDIHVYKCQNKRDVGTMYVIKYVNKECWHYEYTF